MLKFQSINPSGCFSYGLSETIPLDNQGLVHLLGVNEDRDSDSNGSGKSSLFNALCEVVWGANPTQVSGAQVVNNSLYKGFNGRVELIADDGMTYRITYCRDWKDDDFYPVDNDNSCTYAGTSIFFDKFEDGMWRDLRGASMAETRKVIQNTIGLSYDRFISSSYLSPRTGNVILKGTNKERMDLMSGIIGLSEWDNVLDHCRAFRRDQQNGIIDLEKRLSFFEGVLLTLRNERDTLAKTDWADTVVKHETYLLELNVHADELNVQQEKVAKELQDALSKRSIGSTQLKNQISTLNREINLLESRSREPVVESPEMKSLSKELSSLEGELSGAEGLLKSYQSNSDRFLDTPEIKALRAEINKLEGEISALEGKLRAFKGKDGTSLNLESCPTCGSKENWDNIKHSMLEMQQELEVTISSYEKECSTKKEELKTLTETLRIELLTRAEDTVKTIKGQVVNSKALLETERDNLQKGRNSYIEEGRVKAAGLKQQILALEIQVAEVEAQASEVELTIVALNQDNRSINRSIAENNEKITQCSTRIEQYKAQVAKLEDLQNQLVVKEGELADLQAQVDLLKDEASYYDWLIHHAPYIKLHKLSVSLTELSGIVNKYLSSVGESIRVNISSFSEKKGKKSGPMSDMLKSEIELTITDGEKSIDPKLYSDGETSRVSLVIVRALHDMAAKNGNGCNLMFMDEIFSYVDHSSSQKMSDLFNFGGETVVVTDNSGRATDLLSFDSVWTARKKNGVTTLEVNA